MAKVLAKKALTAPISKVEYSIENLQKDADRLLKLQSPEIKLNPQLEAMLEKIRSDEVEQVLNPINLIPKHYY